MRKEKRCKKQLLLRLMKENHPSIHLRNLVSTYLKKRTVKWEARHEITTGVIATPFISSV